MQFAHFGNILRVACDGDAETVHRQHIAVVAVFGVEPCPAVGHAVRGDGGVGCGQDDCR